MTKADKMFKKLGYRQHKIGEFSNWDNSLFDYITFEVETGTVDLGETTPYTVEFHLAIHEKMKELGVLEVDYSQE